MPVTWKALAYEEDVVLKSLFTASSVLVANTLGSPTALTVGTNTVIGRLGGNITTLTASDIRTLINVEDGADVTDATNVAAAGAIMKTIFTAKGQIISSSAANTPGVLNVGTNGKVLVADSSASLGISWQDPPASMPLAHATTHKSGGTDELKLHELGKPTGSVDINNKQLTNVVIHNVADSTARNALTNVVVGQVCFQADTATLSCATQVS